MARGHTSGFEVLGFDTDPTPGDPDVILNQIVPTYTSLGDDAQNAFNALRGNAMADGTGKTMDALRDVIGSKYPPKLQQTADSFHGAAQVYRTYALRLADAQHQVDRAMDKAQSVAGTAARTVAQPPADATPEQLSAATSQQQQVDQANTDLTAAKRLAQDAKDLRDQAGHAFNKALGDVSTVPERSFFQKVLDFFEHNPLIKILIDVAIAITTVFFPIVGLALGAAAFVGETALDTISAGHFDVGAFAAGLLGLALGGLGVAAKFLPTVAKGLDAINSFGKQLPGVGNLIFNKSPNLAAKDLGDLAKQVGKNFAVGFGIQGGLSAVTGLAATGIDDAIEGKKFTGLQAAQVFAGAAAAGAIGGGLKVGNGAIFKDPESPSPPQTPEPAGTRPPDITVTESDDLPPVPTRPPNDQGQLASPDADQRPDALSDPEAVAAPPAIHVTPPGSDAPTISAASSEPGKLTLPRANIDPDGAADPVAVGSGDSLPAITVTPPEGPSQATVAPPAPTSNAPFAADTGAVGSGDPTPPAFDTRPASASPGGDRPDSPTESSPGSTSTGDSEEPSFTHEGTLGRQGFDAANAAVQSVGSQSADVGIAVGLGNDEGDDNGDVETAVADGGTAALPRAAGGAAGDPSLRQLFGGPGHSKR